MHHLPGRDPSEESLRHQVKAELRRSLQRTRALLPERVRRAKSEVVRETLRALGLLPPARSIALFRPIERKGEIDTTGIDRDARALGLRVAYPTLERSAHGATMRFRWVDVPSDELEGALEERGSGFPEPSPSAPEATLDALELVIVPALAYDPTGHRIGYGAGFYDSVLARCLKAKTIGVCFDFQIIAEVPVTKGDVPVSTVITEKRTLITTDTSDTSDTIDTTPRERGR